MLTRLPTFAGGQDERVGGSGVRRQSRQLGDPSGGRVGGDPRQSNALAVDRDGAHAAVEDDGLGGQGLEQDVGPILLAPHIGAQRGHDSSSG
jgi:hypothetical protein